MTQLTQYPFKEVIKRHGALHFWEPDPVTNEVVDLIGGADLIRSSGEDTENAWMTAKAAGDDQSGGPWIGPTLDYCGSVWAGSDQRYLTTPASAAYLTGAFTVFARVKNNHTNGYLRNLLNIVVPGTTFDFSIGLDRYYEANGDFRYALQTRTSELNKTEPFGETYPSGADVTGPVAYLSWSRSDDGTVRARVIIPGVGAFERADPIPRYGSVYFPGFFRSSSTSTVSGGRATFSNAFMLEREATDEELHHWVKLLETGRQGDGRCFPLNNSEGVLAEGIDLASTLLDLEGGTETFAAPGPTEEGRVTLIDPLSPDTFEVCALLVNDGSQLEVRRGEEGTEVREWPAGTLVKGLLTRWLAEAPVDWIPSYATGGYLSEQPSYLALRDKPFIPAVPADIGASSQQALDDLNTRLTGGQTALGGRVTELERGPTWTSIRGKPQLPSMVDIEELRQVATMMMLRIIALEGGGGSDSDYLTDQDGNYLTDASGARLTGAVTAPGALLDQFGAQLTDSSGNILTGPIAG